MDIQKLEALQQDPELLKQLEQVGSMEAFEKMLKEHDIQFTQEELKQAAKEAKGELTEDAMETVAGGLLAPKPTYYYWMWKWLFRRSSGAGYGGGSSGGASQGGGGGGGAGF